MSHPKNNPAGAAPARISITVTGMMCVNCVSHVKHALAGKKGVLGVAVNLIEGQATVDYDPGLIGPEDIRRTIEEAGYGASRAANKTH